MEINNKIIILRDRARMKQEEVANALGISKSSYCRKERGETQFTIDEFSKLLEVFHVAYSDFYEMEFPIVHKEIVPDELLDNLQIALDMNNTISSDWNENRDRYNNIQRALKPVMDKRMEAFDFPDINTVNIPQGTYLKEVLLDARAENLMSRAFAAQNRLAHAIFGAEE
ncbi:MAG: helix-turn-helix transcriptional regulator [Lachnospiraceae bacterium]|nr:helix-turn-helix transcriptional regulator [Lachnospiraceae bacterium]